MPIAAIDDPNIIAQLEKQANGQPNNNLSKEINDPDAIRQLESLASSQSNNIDQSFLHKLIPNILAGLGEGVKNIVNIPSNIAMGAEKYLGGADRPDTLAKMANLHASDIPRFPDIDFSKKLSIPGTATDKLIQSLISNIPSVLMPEIEGLSGLGILGKAAGRAIPQAGYGAATSPDAVKGAEEFGGGQLAMEAVGLPFRGIGKVAEIYNPSEYAKNKLNDIVNYYKANKDQQKQLYSSIDPLKENTLSLSPESLFDKNDVNNFTTNAKKVYNNFIDEPTLGNAHKLQSQLFSSTNQLNVKDQATLSSLESMSNARNSLIDRISSYLSHADPNIAKDYEDARKLTRETIAPIESSKPIKEAAKGNLDSISPTDLSSEISKVISNMNEGRLAKGGSGSKLPQNHFMNMQLGELNNVINRGKALQYGVPMIGGAALGALSPNLFSPEVGGLLGSALGAGGGAALSAASPKFAELSQNPWIIKMLQNAEKGFQGMGREAIGYNANNQ